MEPTIGLHAENCQPPLGHSPELIESLRGLQEGERGVECGVSGNLGTGTICELAGFQMGDTIMFDKRHIAAGDYGVIVGLERWLDDSETVSWDGVGDAPTYAGKLVTPNVERFLVRLESHNPDADDAIDGLKGWRERCLQWPHSYPHVAERDMQLVSRPQIKRLNDTGCLGSVVGMDDRQSLTCISDSEAGARKAMADMKAARCLPLRKQKEGSEV